jgi:hypothetical protein
VLQELQLAHRNRARREAKEEGRERTMDHTEEANAVEPAGKKRTRWWVIVLLIVLIVVLGFCLWVLVGPAIGNVYEQVTTATP